MGQITITEIIDAPVETVFDYVDDYTNTTKYMKDLTQWEPVGPKNHGQGAIFAVAMQAGPKSFGSVVDVYEWAANRTIAWKSKEGFKQKGRWTFRSKGKRTEAKLDMEFDLGGGIAGKLVARAAEPILRMNLQKSVNQLKEQVEAMPKASAKMPMPAMPVSTSR